MEGVLQALQRVRDNVGAAHAKDPLNDKKPGFISPLGHNSGVALEAIQGPPVMLDRAALLANKIVSFDSSRDQTRPYDVLRNLVLDDLAEIESRTISVTAPTGGCGATVTAANIALSIARLRTTKVLLLECNDASPGLAKALSVPALLGDDGRADEDAWVRTVEIEGVRLQVGSLAQLNGDGRLLDRSGAAPFEIIEQKLGPVTIVLDLPPILVGDQTLPLILGADVVLLVLAVGRSTVTEFEACKSYLNENSRVHVVLNKSRMHGL